MLDHLNQQSFIQKAFSFTSYVRNRNPFTRTTAHLNDVHRDYILLSNKTTLEIHIHTEVGISSDCVRLRYPKVMTDDSVRAVRQWLAVGSQVEEGMRMFFKNVVFCIFFFFFLVVKKRSKELVPFLFQSLYTSGMRWTMTGACLCCSPIRQTETLLSPGALVRTLITEMITNLDYRECESRLRPVCPELRRTKNDLFTLARSCSLHLRITCALPVHG